MSTHVVVTFVVASPSHSGFSSSSSGRRVAAWRPQSSSRQSRRHYAVVRLSSLKRRPRPRHVIVSSRSSGMRCCDVVALAGCQWTKSGPWRGGVCEEEKEGEGEGERRVPCHLLATLRTLARSLRGVPEEANNLNLTTREARAGVGRVSVLEAKTLIRAAEDVRVGERRFARCSRGVRTFFHLTAEVAPRAETPWRWLSIYPRITPNRL